jgi:lipopolysaccharide/colanic/teichoic acid biosynthesis glycosyltransferase
MKRLFDFIFSSIGLIILSPIILIVSILIKLTSRGPVFYLGRRMGRGGREFKMFKFRTMVDRADTMGGPSTASDDPRLTKVGLFLKKFQLDEIPQLMNVFRGDMSLVGPRPEVKMYVDMMNKEEKELILSVRPGMTDLASLWNFHEGEILKGAKDPEKVYMEKIRPKKLELQKEYVKTRSFFGDLKIILKTILKIFK